MRDKNIDGNLVETLREMLDMAQMSDGGKSTKTSIGSMQGSTLSPLLFAFYINDMLTELQRHSDSLALADDLVSHCDGDLALFQTITILERNCRELGLSINKSKSAVVILRDS